MLNKLEQHFGSNFIVHNEGRMEEGYHWFKTPENVTIGFPIDQITNAELSLLTIFLSPINSNNSYQLKSSEEILWSSILFDTENASIVAETPNDPFRFIHIDLKGELSEPDTLVEAVKSLFPTKTVILWESETQGIIIDLEPDITDQIENLYNSITDTITSDFYIDMSLYIGLKNSSVNEAKSRFNWEKACFSVVRQSLKRKVYQGEELIPFLLLHETSPSTLFQVAEQLLNNVVNDKDLIKSVKVYLDCNMNISLAAKKLYLHRNTLQYRVEKFIEKTGIDIRHFNNAVSIYLALLINDCSK